MTERGSRRQARNLKDPSQRAHTVESPSKAPLPRLDQNRVNPESWLWEKGLADGAEVLLDLNPMQSMLPLFCFVFLIKVRGPGTNQIPSAMLMFDDLIADFTRRWNEAAE